MTHIESILNSLCVERAKTHIERDSESTELLARGPRVLSHKHRILERQLRPLGWRGMGASGRQRQGRQDK
eukprot:4999238-Pyramimonas_sp.AAC.1